MESYMKNKNYILLFFIVACSLFFLSASYKDHRWLLHGKKYECINTNLDRTSSPERMEETANSLEGGCTSEISSDKNMLTLTCYARGEKTYFAYFISEQLCEQAAKRIIQSKKESENKNN